MATVSHHVLLGCDGFCVETADGPIGWVEEAWLGPDEDPAALALHLVDGRRGLLLADDVEAVASERESVRARDGARLLQLGTPHLVRDGAASWEATGELVAAASGLPDQAVLELRPWRLRPARASEWRPIAVLLPALALLIALEIALAFTIAYLVTGRAY
ncbi:MAG: hypothetical protein E6F98_12280 [Actinobacteria bacterium]|nr:MAG: hypothetical protein E6F98_12280 [Actinomycetota bacterium]